MFISEGNALELELSEREKFKDELIQFDVSLVYLLNSSMLLDSNNIKIDYESFVSFIYSDCGVPKVFNYEDNVAGIYDLLKLVFKRNLTSNVLYYDGKSFMFERYLSLSDDDCTRRYIFFVIIDGGAIYIRYEMIQSKYIISMTELERVRNSMQTLWVGFRYYNTYLPN